MSEKKTEVAKKEKTDLANPAKLPDGFDEPFEREDLEMPRAKIVQSTTQEFKDEKVKLGTIVHSLNLEELPKTFIPLFKFTFWIRWNPRKTTDENFDPAYDAGAQIYRTDDPNDHRLLKDKDWGPNGEPPRATKFLNFLCVFEGIKTPIVVSFAKTSMRAGRRLFSLAMNFAMENGEPMYGRKYTLTSKKTASGGNEYFIAEVAPAGKVAEDQIPQLKQLHDKFVGRKKDIEVHDIKEEEKNWDE